MCDKQTIIHRKPSPQSFTSATLMIHKRMSLLIEVCTTPYKKNDAKGKKWQKLLKVANLNASLYLANQTFEM